MTSPFKGFAAFKGVNWRAVNLVKRIWASRDIMLTGENIDALPVCPKYVLGNFNCAQNYLVSLAGSPTAEIATTKQIFCAKDLIISAVIYLLN
jgi:hypothetical protein